MRLYAYFEDAEGRVAPAFDTDIFLHHTPEDLEKLRDMCEEAAEERPHLTYVIVDLDHRCDPDGPLASSADGIIDVFGRLLREQEAAIDWNEVRVQARAHGPGTAEGG